MSKVSKIVAPPIIETVVPIAEAPGLKRVIRRVKGVEGSIEGEVIKKTQEGLNMDRNLPSYLRELANA